MINLVTKSERTFSKTCAAAADYLYNGKELQEELGLNWLSFGFREYDPAIARFPSVDPIADQFAHVSGFNYAENDPVRYIDLWGLQQALPEDQTYSATADPVEVTASRSPDQERGRYEGYNGTFEEWQKEFGQCQGCSDANEENFYYATDNGAHDANVAARDQAEKERIAVENMAFWMGEVFPTVATLLAPSGGTGNGGGVRPKPFKFSAPPVPKLQGAVKNNFKRFVKKIPKNSKSNASYKQLDDGSYTFKATSPGKVPGSKAVYQKWVNPKGETTKMTKTTYAPDGSIIHIKPKF